MAVEARHLRLFSPQLLLNREFGKAAETIPTMLGDPKDGLCIPIAGTGQLIAPLYSMDIAAAGPSEGSFTWAVSAGKKRQREPFSSLEEDLYAIFQYQMADLDRLLAHHWQRMRAELMERRKHHARELAAAVDFVVRKRVKAKDDEIERGKKLNWALEERIRALFVENQIWRELAQSNEATANLLRDNLDQLLAAQVGVKEEDGQGCVGTMAAGDAESCCCGENDNREVAAVDVSSAKTCRCCGWKEPTVLLLPCRHLCVCAACGPAVDSCPICNCNKSGSVNVNLA